MFEIKWGTLVATTIAASLAAGCVATKPSFPGPRTVNTKTMKFFGTDASRRYIMTAERLDGGSPTGRITCAEPSPDVAVATSEAISAALSGSGSSGSGAEGQGEGSFSHSVAQSVAELGQRAVTVQLLRDALYRACEAYANGAIDDGMYAVLLSRMDDLMVTLLTAESMSGAISSSSAAIAAGAVMAGGEGGAGGGGLEGAVAGHTTGATGAVQSVGSDFVEMHKNFLSDPNSGTGVLAVACIAALSDNNNRDTALFEKCMRFMDITNDAVAGQNAAYLSRGGG